MSIRRSLLPFERDFAQIPNAWLRDERLSRRARGLLAELMTHRDGFVITFAAIVRGGPEGKDAMRAAVDELREYGYLTLVQDRDSGRFGEVQYELHDPAASPPLDPTSTADDRAENPPQSDLPLPGKPLPVNPPPKNTSSQNTTSPDGDAGGDRELTPVLVAVEEPGDVVARILAEERARVLQRPIPKRKLSPRARAAARRLGADVDAERLAAVLRWAFDPATEDPWWLGHILNPEQLEHSWERLESRYLAASRAVAPTTATGPQDDLSAMLAAAYCSPVDWEYLDEQQRAQVRQTALQVGWRPTRPEPARA